MDSKSFAALVEQRDRQETFDVIMTLAHHVMAGVMQRALDQRPPEGWNPATPPTIAGIGTPNGRTGEFVALGPRPALSPDVDENSYYRFPLLRATK